MIVCSGVHQGRVGWHSKYRLTPGKPLGGGYDSRRPLSCKYDPGVWYLHPTSYALHSSEWWLLTQVTDMTCPIGTQSMFGLIGDCQIRMNANTLQDSVAGCESVDRRQSHWSPGFKMSTGARAGVYQTQAVSRVARVMRPRPRTSTHRRGRILF